MMDWIPAISTTLLLAIVIWLGRNLIITRLKNAVAHEYEEKIEGLRTELRKSEEAFKAELRAKASQIEALRSGALSSIVNRQAALYGRQIKAVEELWGAVLELAPAKAISAWMVYVKFDEAAKMAEKDPNARDMFRTMGGDFDIAKINPIGASKARPFLSPLAWAYFAAYQAIVMHSVIKLKQLQLGISGDYIDIEAITQIVKTALPDQAAYIKKHGSSAFYFLLGTLELKLLEAIGFMLEGKELDKKDLEKAASIIEGSERLMKSNAESEKQI